MSITATLSSVLSRVPDLAAVQIPEPSGLALFSLGLAGMVLGRKFAKKPADKAATASSDQQQD